MPWGKYRGVALHLIPSAYLSFLATGTVILREPRWDWLRASLISELKFRGLNTEGLDDNWEPSELSELPQEERDRVVAIAFALHKRRGPGHIDEYHEGVLGRCDCIAQVLSDPKQKPLPFPEKRPRRNISLED